MANQGIPSGRTIVTMVDNRPPEHAFIRYSSAIAQKYADLHGYHFRYYVALPMENDPLQACTSLKGQARHVSWAKLPALFQLLSEDFDWICYVDTDVLFTDISKSIPHFIAETPAAWGAKNGDILFLNNKPYGFIENNDFPCAGVILVRASDMARSFVRTWYELDTPVHDLQHPWEQNALWEIYRSFPQLIGVLDSWMFREVAGQWLRHVPHFEDRESRFASEFQRHPGLSEGVRANNTHMFDAMKVVAKMESTQRHRSFLNAALKYPTVRRALRYYYTIRTRGVSAVLRSRLRRKRAL